MAVSRWVNVLALIILLTVTFVTIAFMTEHIQVPTEKLRLTSPSETSKPKQKPTTALTTTSTSSTPSSIPSPSSKPVSSATSTASITDITERKDEDFGMLQPYRDVPIPEDYTLDNETCGVTSSIPPLIDDMDRMPESLRSYALFHRAARACLESGNEKCPNGQDLPKVLVWKGELARIGGWGDRLISLRFLVLLAIVTKRVFFIEWPNQAQTPYDLSSALHPTYFDWRLPDNFTQFASTRSNISVWFHVGNNPSLSSRPRSFQNPFPGKEEERLESSISNFHEEFKPFDIIFNTVTHVFRDDIVLLARNKNNVFKAEGLQKMKYISLQRVLTRFMFRPSPAVVYLARTRSFPPNTPYSAVHVRTGLDVFESELDRFKYIRDSNTHTNMSRVLLTCVERHLNIFLKKDENKTRVFLASDSKDFQGSFIAQAEKMGIVAKSGMRYVWHMDKYRSDRFTDDLDHCIGFLEIFADSYAISEAKSVVYITSNFPEVAIGTGNVRAWYRFEDSNRTELTPKECTPLNMSTPLNPDIRL